MPRKNFMATQGRCLDRRKRNRPQQSVPRTIFYRTVRVWNIDSGEVEQTLEGHSDSVRGVAFSPDGSKLASASDDRTVRVWNVDSRKVEQTLEGHSDFVVGVAFSPDGRKLASASADRTVRVWNVDSGEIEQTLKGHTSLVNGVAFSPGGSRCYAQVEELNRWVILNGVRTLYLPPGYEPSCVASKGSTLAIGTKTGRVTMISFRSDVKVGSI
jgi:WD40 repeat protein